MAITPALVVGVIILEALKSATFETKRLNLEKLHKLSREHTAYLGRIAIRAEYIGIDDNLADLLGYIREGEMAMPLIKENLETNIAERLRETPFRNYVGFNFNGSDFISVKDTVSMASMTKKALQIFQEESANNPGLDIERVRAEIEANEVDKLVSWFRDAPIGAHMIFESLPIGKQTIAVPRIYQKKSATELEGCFVSLYNPSINLFNDLHEVLGLNVPIGKNEIEILQNNYEYYNPNVIHIKSFIDSYIKTYDDLLNSKTGQTYSFGLETDENVIRQNGIQKVRNQPRLTTEYIKTIKLMAASDGIATPEIININNKLDTGYELADGQSLSIDIIRKILDKMILGITSAIDTGENELLGQLEESYSGSDTNFEAISYFAGQATARGETYDSNGCPEFSRAQTMSEQEAIEQGLRIKSEETFNPNSKLPKNFGKPKIGVCRISNCPSRGDIWWWPDKTLVGGCSVCLHCHGHFARGRSPEDLYEKQKQEQEQKTKKIAKIESDKKLAAIAVDTIKDIKSKDAISLGEFTGPKEQIKSPPLKV